MKRSFIKRLNKKDKLIKRKKTYILGVRNKITISSAEIQNISNIYQLKQNKMDQIFEYKDRNNLLENKICKTPEITCMVKDSVNRFLFAQERSRINKWDHTNLKLFYTAKTAITK